MNIVVEVKEVLTLADGSPLPAVPEDPELRGLVELQRDPPPGYMALLRRCGCRAVKRRKGSPLRTVFYVDLHAAFLVDRVDASLSLVELGCYVRALVDLAARAAFVSHFLLSGGRVSRAELGALVGASG